MLRMQTAVFWKPVVGWQQHRWISVLLRCPSEAEWNHFGPDTMGKWMVRLKWFAFHCVCFSVVFYCSLSLQLPLGKFRLQCDFYLDGFGFGFGVRNFLFDEKLSSMKHTSHCPSVWAYPSQPGCLKRVKNVHPVCTSRVCVCQGGALSNSNSFPVSCYCVFWQ